jgi:hypothetical protein
MSFFKKNKILTLILILIALFIIIFLFNGVRTGRFIEKDNEIYTMEEFKNLIVKN